MEPFCEEVDPSQLALEDDYFDELLGNFHLTPSTDNLLAIPTQQMLHDDNGSDTTETRYGKPMSDIELKEKLNNRIPTKTRRANAWSVSVYKNWVKFRNTQVETFLCPDPLQEDICMATNRQLNYWLARFVMETRRQDGLGYSPSSLQNIIAGLQSHLRENGRHVNFFKKDDQEFLTFRQSLDSRMKELTAAGVGVVKKRADPITEKDEKLLWDRGTFNTETSTGLSYAVFFYNCKLFGMRAMDEHRNLQAEQFSISTDEVGKYLSFSGRISKNVQGGLDHRRISPNFIKQYADPSNPRCIMSVYERYLSAISPNGAVYLRPLPSTAQFQNPRFSRQVIGANTLDKYMKKMFGAAEISTSQRHITNHSGKVTCATTLYNKRFSDKAVMGRTGHRSNAVQVYKREAPTMLRNISNALQPPKPAEIKMETISTCCHDYNKM